MCLIYNHKGHIDLSLRHELIPCESLNFPFVKPGSHNEGIYISLFHAYYLMNFQAAQICKDVVTFVALINCVKFLNMAIQTC